MKKVVLLFLALISFNINASNITIVISDTESRTFELGDNASYEVRDGSVYLYGDNVDVVVEMTDFEEVIKSEVSYNKVLQYNDFIVTSSSNESVDLYTEGYKIAEIFPNQGYKLNLPVGNYLMLDYKAIIKIFVKK